MPANSKKIKTDIEETPIPQYFNPTTDDFEVLTGRDGANAFIEKGRIVKDAFDFDGSETVTKTYDTKMYGFGIINEGATDLWFTIGTITIKVKPHRTFDDLFEPFQSVTVKATDSFDAVVRE